jgi:hypothetical protein
MRVSPYLPHTPLSKNPFLNIEKLEELGFGLLGAGVSDMAMMTAARMKSEGERRRR